jgi:hypothetical protein
MVLEAYLGSFANKECGSSSQVLICCCDLRDSPQRLVQASRYHDACEDRLWPMKTLRAFKASEEERGILHAVKRDCLEAGCNVKAMGLEKPLFWSKGSSNKFSPFVISAFLPQPKITTLSSIPHSPRLREKQDLANHPQT